MVPDTLLNKADNVVLDFSISRGRRVLDLFEEKYTFPSFVDSPIFQILSHIASSIGLFKTFSTLFYMSNLDKALQRYDKMSDFFELPPNLAFVPI